MMQYKVTYYLQVRILNGTILLFHFTGNQVIGKISEVEHMEVFMHQ